MSKIAQKKYTLSYPDSVRLLEESVKKDKAIRAMMEGMIEQNEEALRKAINKCVYDNAERLGVSVYYLCFHTVPEYEYEGMLGTIRLAPVEFDLTHDGGYWKKMYFNLKKKMQALIDEKEDE